MENAKLAEVNERLRLLLVQMPEIIREEETLAMKLRVHDDIGHSILAARRVLLQHTDLTEIRANAALWEQSISVLYRSSQITAQSEPLEAAKNERKPCIQPGADLSDAKKRICEAGILSASVCKRTADDLGFPDCPEYL